MSLEWLSSVYDKIKIAHSAVQILFQQSCFELTKALEQHHVGLFEEMNIIAKAFLLLVSRQKLSNMDS